jgi:hypothetical protein
MILGIQGEASNVSSASRKHGELVNNLQLYKHFRATLSWFRKFQR